jgi:hypothetical protein
MKKCLVVSLTVCLSVIMIGAAMAGSQNGRAGQVPAFYDGKLHTINLKQMPPAAEGALLEHNKSINHIFVVEPSDEQEELIAVLDAIQGDGFNPLWQEVLISPPIQFTSDTDVLAAAANGTITLTFTNEVYRCSVVGPKK